MGKADRNRNQSARERIAAQQAAARQAEARRRMLLAGGAVAIVLIVVLVIVIVKVTGKSPAAKTGPASGTALPASVQRDFSTVPASTLTAVGQGTAASASVKAVTGPALTSGGKPEMLYIGAEWCPYCAAMRWAMATALSRFGTFSTLNGVHSDAQDVYPNTATLTFYKSTYTSKYLVFMPVEETTVSKATLQTPTAAQQALITKYDSPPYVSSTETGAIPFIDFAGQYLVHGAQYNPQDLQGKTWAEVAAALNDQSSTIGKGADGAANTITAAICKITKDKPASVCGTSMIKSLQGQL
jgi:thiol-disulfide isomerase/thioredoxin